MFLSSLKDETDNPDEKKMNKRKSKAGARIRRKSSITAHVNKNIEEGKPSGGGRRSSVRRNSLYVPKNMQRKSILKNRVDNEVKA